MFYHLGSSGQSRTKITTVRTYSYANAWRQEPGASFEWNTPVPGRYATYYSYRGQNAPESYFTVTGVSEPFFVPDPCGGTYQFRVCGTFKTNLVECCGGPVTAVPVEGKFSIAIASY
jgi:hypothetical protein